MKNKKIIRLIFIAIFLPLILIPFVSPIANAYTVPNSDAGSSPVYLLTGDMIKDVKFVSIGGDPIDQGGGAYDNKLKFEMSPLWKLERDDIELIYTHQVGNKIYMFYKMALTADMNVYTNVRYNDGSEKQEQWNGKQKVFEYHRYGLYGDEFTQLAWSRELQWHSWDFGNVRDYNSKNNVYGGTVEIQFNIQQSPFPSTLIDEEGNVLTKQFDYIGVSSAAVLSSDHGFLSQASPDIRYSVPQEDQSQEIKRVDPDPSPGAVDGGYQVQWRTNARIEDAGLDTWDAGIQVPSGDSSLNPTRADGGPIYDNTMDNETSQTDCKLYYNLGSLTPVVTEYFGRLEYDTLRLKAQDTIFGYDYSPTPGHESKMLSTAIHISNRYAHSKLQTVLNVWSSYEIEVIDTPEMEDYNLEKPVEYYDNLTWQTAVDGISSMEINEPGDRIGDFEGTGNVFNGILDMMGQYMIYIIIFAVIMVALYITIKLVRTKSRVQTLRTIH